MHVGDTCKPKHWWTSPLSQEPPFNHISHGRGNPLAQESAGLHFKSTITRSAGMEDMAAVLTNHFWQTLSLNNRVRAMDRGTSALVAMANARERSD